MTPYCPRRSAFVGAAVLLVPAALAAQCPDPNTAAYPDSLCPSCAEWNAPQRPFRIPGNTYYVGTRGLTARLVTGGEGHVLIDGGLPNTGPLILERVRERLHAEFREPPSQADLAATAQVHPAHMSRVFRRHHGCTIAGYVRRLRLEWTKTALRAHQVSIGRIAAEAGFASRR